MITTSNLFSFQIRELTLPRILFLFLDGVGLGTDDPDANPFARANLPHLHNLLGGRRLVANSASPAHISSRATLLALDACLGVPGLPQSATGQAALLTGVNVPAKIGYHYGPKPNPEVAAFLKNGNLFSQLRQQGLKAALLNAYPPGYFQGITSGHRIFSAIPLAVTSAGLHLHNSQDLNAGNAISADLTGDGWHTQLRLPETPRLTFTQAGQRLAEVAGPGRVAW